MKAEATGQVKTDGSTPHTPTASRRGFTLLEVLIAAVLTAVLIAGLWSVFDIYAGLFEKGQAKAQHAALVRAIQRQLTDDLRSTIVVIPSESSSSQSWTTEDSPSETDPMTAEDLQSTPASPTESSSSSRTSASPNSPMSSSPEESDSTLVDDPLAFPSASADGAAGPPGAAGIVGLAGSQNSLTLDVLVSVNPHSISANPDLETSGTVGLRQQQLEQQRQSRGGISRVPELGRVVYSFDAPLGLSRVGGGGSGLTRRFLSWEEAHAATASASDSLEESSPFGQSSLLSETVEPQSLLPEDDMLTGQDRQGRGSQDQAEDARIGFDESIDRIPEVTRFQLSYFDGTSWYDQWDSRAQGALPVAVEVRFDIQDGSEEPASDSLEEEGATVYETEIDPTEEDLQSQWKQTDAVAPTGGTTALTEELLPPPYRLLVYLAPPDQQTSTGSSQSSIFGGTSP